MTSEKIADRGRVLVEGENDEGMVLVARGCLGFIGLGENPFDFSLYQRARGITPTINV